MTWHAKQTAHTHTHIMKCPYTHTSTHVSRLTLPSLSPGKSTLKEKQLPISHFPALTIFTEFGLSGLCCRHASAVLTSRLPVFRRKVLGWKVLFPLYPLLCMPTCLPRKRWKSWWKLGRWEQVDISLVAANICLRVNNPTSDLFHIWLESWSSCRIVSTLRLSLTFDIHCQFGSVCSFSKGYSFMPAFFMCAPSYIFHGILMRAKAHRQTLLSLKPHKLSSKAGAAGPAMWKGTLQLFQAKNVQSSVRDLIAYTEKMAKVLKSIWRKTC